MILIEDTRQQMWAGDKHANVRDYCRRQGIEIMRTALPYGDYCLIDEETGEPKVENAIVVDTKQDIMELSGNLMSRDHRRVRDECLRAQAAGTTLIFLVEEVPPFGRLDMWEPPVWRHSGRGHTAGQPMTLVNPVNLRKTCITMQKKYGVKFRFCDGRSTGRQLIEYLTGKRA